MKCCARGHTQRERRPTSGSAFYWSESFKKHEHYLNTETNLKIHLEDSYMKNISHSIFRSLKPYSHQQNMFS